jgi:pantothenate kinase
LTSAQGAGRQAPQAYEGTIDSLIIRARGLGRNGQRRILGLTGPPGSGKSTLAELLVNGLAPEVVLVPMDGFHLAKAELERLGRRDRMGAIDTFDAWGYVSLLRRLRNSDDEVVYAPEFRREFEEPIAGAILVTQETPLVITEGNYLLVDDPPWSELAELLDEVWYLDPGEDVRIQRLVARHSAYGKSPAEANAWSHGSDQRNSELVAQTRDRADLVVRLLGDGHDAGSPHRS